MVPWDNLNRRLFPASSSRRPNNEAYNYELLSSDSSLSSPPPHDATSSLRRPSPPLSPPSLRRSIKHPRSLLRYCLHVLPSQLLHQITLRRLLYLVISIPLLLAIGILLNGGIPPSYDSIRQFERRLPQHNASLPSPEGGDGHYLRFGNGIWGHGWNNVLQEILLHSHLSYLLRRSYVFEPYTWSHTPLPWTIYDFALRPAQIPLNAFISGPSAGGAMTSRPRSVSSEWWEGVCGEKALRKIGRGKERAVVWALTVGKDNEEEVEVEYFGIADDENEHRGIGDGESKHAYASNSTVKTRHWHDRPRTLLPPTLRPRTAKETSRRVKWGRVPRAGEGEVILRWWFDHLKTLDEIRCVEIRGAPAFDQFLFNSPRLLSLWPSLRSSPVVTHFSWSPLVQAGVTRNLHFILPNALSISPASLFPPPPAPFSSSSPSSLPSTSHNVSLLPPPYNSSPLPTLLALHLRRGDYIRHCPRLARWGATFQGFNSFPEFGRDELWREPEFLSFSFREDIYRRRCWPTVNQVVEKLRNVREGWMNHTAITSGSSSSSEDKKLRHLYLMTNAWPSFVNELREALLADGWETLTSSLDVERGLDGEQKWVSMAVDMAVAERAAVVVGNGFSSLTSNIVMLRMAKHLDPKSVHFW